MTVIGIAGQPAWAESAAAHLTGATVVRYTERTGFVARLADDRTALLLVDGGDADWRFWTVTPKISPATRRVPVVLVTDSANQRDQALRGGTNLVLGRHELVASLPMLLAEVARVPDPAALALLERQCGEPLPPEALDAVAKFNRGEYHEQHDAFEALWMAEPGPVRQLYQGVLQVGIAYYQITRGNGRGALKMLLRSIQWLAPLPDVCQGIDVARLRADAAAVRAELERVGVDNPDRFDLILLQPVHLIE
jgi:hypothetical protein